MPMPGGDVRVAYWHVVLQTPKMPARRLFSVGLRMFRNENTARDFVDRGGEANVEKVYRFKLLNGSEGSAPFWQMLQHLVNHASYHRGQVTTMLRQMGAQPAKSLDMIAFYRTRKGE